MVYLSSFHVFIYVLCMHEFVEGWKRKGRSFCFIGGKGEKGRAGIIYIRHALVHLKSGPLISQTVIQWYTAYICVQLLLFTAIGCCSFYLYMYLIHVTSLSDVGS